MKGPTLCLGETHHCINIQLHASANNTCNNIVLQTAELADGKTPAQIAVTITAEACVSILPCNLTFCLATCHQ